MDHKLSKKEVNLLLMSGTKSYRILHLLIINVRSLPLVMSRHNIPPLIWEGNSWVLGVFPHTLGKFLQVLNALGSPPTLD
jgi:hypothetical protein